MDCRATMALIAAAAGSGAKLRRVLAGLPAALGRVSWVLQAGGWFYFTLRPQPSPTKQPPPGGAPEKGDFRRGGVGRWQRPAPRPVLFLAGRFLGPSWIQHRSLDSLTDGILLSLGKPDVDAHYANSQPWCPSATFFKLSK